MTTIDAQTLMYAVPAGSALIGFAVGYAIRKVLSFIFKLALVFFGLMLAVFLYLRAQGVFIVDMRRLEEVSNTALNTVVRYSNEIGSTNGNGSEGLGNSVQSIADRLVSILGIGGTGSLFIGFLAGLYIGGK